MSDPGVEQVRAVLMNAFEALPEGDSALVLETDAGEFRVTVTRTSVCEVVTRVGDGEARLRRYDGLLADLGFGPEGELVEHNTARWLLEEFVADEVARVRRREMTEALGDRH